MTRENPPSTRRLLEEMGVAEQAAFLNSVLEASTEYSIIATDLDGLILAWNEGARRTHGHESSDVVGKANAYSLHHPDDVKSGKAREILQEVRRNGKWEGILRRLRKNEDEFHAHVTKTLRRDAAGKAVGFTIISRDLTEAERESQDRFFTLSLDMLCIAHSDGYFKRVSPAFTQTLGWSEQEMLTRPFLAFVHPDDQAATLREVEKQTVAGERVLHFENRYQHKDGSWRILSWKSIPQPGGMMYATARDVTEQVEQSRRIQEASRLKSEFLANMSHELRTPLNAIIGFAQLMHDGKVGPVSSEHSEYLGDILTSSRHLLQLINDVLDLAKVESGKLEFVAEPVRLETLVSESRDILRTLAAQKRIPVEIRVDPAVGTVMVDPAKLKQVLYNYLSNALKFTPDEGRVVVRILPEDADHFRVEVEDTGIGIRPEDLPRLFVEFHQLDATTAKKYQGTGLGLALTKRMVEAQGGRVWAESTPGRGSVFFAVLPRVAEVIPHQAAPPSEVP